MEFEAPALICRVAVLIEMLAASLPVLAQAPEGRPPTLAVVMDFDGRYSPVSVRAMESELESVMRPCSIHFQWRILDESTPKESFSNLVVAHFKGDCRDEPVRAPEEQTRILGLTHISDGDILPFSDVDCDRVREFVGRYLGNDRRRADRLLGRALGRVLAHELYHVLARTQHHAHSGLTKAMLTPRELLSGKPHLSPSQAASIVRALIPHPPLIHRAAAAY